MQYVFELKFKVRDYECDLEGIVNNANYQHYMEHTRHEFMLSAGLSFADMYAQGITPVVARITISYKMPLRSRDEFVSKLSVRKEGVRYVFLQDIFRLPDMKLVARGRVDTVCLVQGRLKECAELEKYLEPYFDKEG
ncbi:MAG: acyl-CoA thioesterase [Bacteroidaceae bacterium]|jgi:acyl-CoA thioester hydrolase|nr:acyl-CoA thioesterase [Bacteroidaceae bacterium]MBQ7987875.1 acyl-CoA thioesterase [Bacteroidaceae bacterium]